jgi:hypothetical protein
MNPTSCLGGPMCGLCQIRRLQHRPAEVLPAAPLLAWPGTSRTLLTRRFARHTGRSWCWERPECEAMRARGQTLPNCLFISDEITVCMGGTDGDTD